MNWLCNAAIRLWKGTGVEPVSKAPLYKLPVLPKSLVVRLSDEVSEGYRQKKCTCYACKSNLSLLEILRASSFFNYYPGQGFADGKRVPLVVFDCPRCKDRQYAAVYPDYVEVGIFGAASVMDPIPMTAIKVAVIYELHPDRMNNLVINGNDIVVPLDEDYYIRLYGRI